MHKEKDVIALTLGKPFDKKSRSGVNHAVLSRMAEMVNLIDAFDCSLVGLQRYISAIRSFKVNLVDWKREFNQNPYAFEKRSELCDRLLMKYNGKYDAVYQDGAMFIPRSNNVMFVTNHDANAILTAKGGEYSVGSHYFHNPRLLTETIKQEKEVYERADHIFVRSNWVKESLVNDFKIPEHKITINPSGVHFQVPDVLHKEYKGRDVLFVGKDLPIKGFDNLLKAFELMVKNKKDVVLHVVGTTHTEEMSTDHIKFYGFLGADKIETLKKLFTLADLFILPSRYDAFPKVLIEAGAYRIPCISTNVCGIPEIVENGINGFTVEPEDYMQMAKLGLDILQDQSLSKTMGDAGFKNYKEKFNWDRHVREVVKVINEK